MEMQILGWILVVGGLFGLGLATGVTIRDVQLDRGDFRATRWLKRVWED